MNKPLVAELRAQISKRQLVSDGDFLFVAELAGLLCGLTGEDLPESLATYVCGHQDPSTLMIDGLREVEHTYLEALGEDLAMAVTLTQKWVLLASAVSKALRSKGIHLSPLFWVCLRHLGDLSCDADLSEDAVEALYQWRSHTGLPSDKQIAAIETILSGADRDLLNVLAIGKREKRKETA